MTNFFSQIKSYCENHNLSFVITADDSTITLIFKAIPKIQDAIKDKLPDLQLTGTPEELDAQFFELLEKPFESTANLLDQIQKYEREIQNKLLEAKAFTEQNRKIATLLEAAKSLQKEDKFSPALSKIKEILSLVPDHAEALQLEKELTKSFNSNTLFQN